MTSSKQYTPENCKLVGELVNTITPNAHRGQYFPPEYCQFNKEFPQLLREALAAEGVSIGQQATNCKNYGSISQLGLFHGNKAAVPFITVYWDYDTDPTARHALFAAVVEYLKSKEKK